MTTLLIRLVHYLPTAHLALGAFSAAAAIWVLVTSMTDFTPPGLESLQWAGALCRWLAVIYLAIGAALQLRLSRSGHGILAQPSKLWVLYIANQALLLAVLIVVVARDTHSRVHMAGLHHGVAALLIVSGLSLLFAAVDRLAATGLARTIPGWNEEVASDHTAGLSVAFVVVAALLLLSLALLEAQPLPHSSIVPVRA